MNFMTQLGVLAIILIILVILIKSNRTLEQIYMEGETEKETIEIPSFKIPEFRFDRFSDSLSKKAKRKMVYEDEAAEKEGKVNAGVARSSNTIPVEIMSGWYLEMVDSMGRSFGRVGIKGCPFSIGRAEDNDYVVDDLSVSGHHACVESSGGIWELEDQGSLNKILVGGRPVTKVALVDGLEVSLGNTRIRFCKEEKQAAHTTAYKRNSPIEEWY